MIIDINEVSNLIEEKEIELHSVLSLFKVTEEIKEYSYVKPKKDNENSDIDDIFDF